MHLLIQPEYEMIIAEEFFKSADGLVPPMASWAVFVLSLKAARSQKPDGHASIIGLFCRKDKNEC